MGNPKPGFGPQLHICFEEEEVLTLFSSIFPGKSEWWGDCLDRLFANVAIIIWFPSHGDSVAIPVKNWSLFSLPVTFGWPCGFHWPTEDKGSDWAQVTRDCAHPPAPPEPTEPQGEQARHRVPAPEAHLDSGRWRKPGWEQQQWGSQEITHGCYLSTLRLGLPCYTATVPFLSGGRLKGQIPLCSVVAILVTGTKISHRNFARVTHFLFQ